MTQTATSLEQITQPIKNAFNGLLKGDKTVGALLIVVALLIIALCLCNNSSEQHAAIDKLNPSKPSQALAS
jgi:hypothetical protein